jgi:hypothetical protein
VYYAPTDINSTINLQATLSASSSGCGDPITPHAPITCTSDLFFHEDNSLACEHAHAPPGDLRTQACLDASVAILLFEVLRQREDADVPRSGLVLR